MVIQRAACSSVHIAQSGLTNAGTKTLTCVIYQARQFDFAQLAGWLIEIIRGISTLKQKLQIALLALIGFGTMILPTNAQHLKNVEYEVIGVAYNDVLNMRAGPGTKHPVIGSLRPNARGIWILRCSNYINWCQVTRRGRRGWVNMRYLTVFANSDYD